jgi:O-antigen ligase
VIYLFAAIYVGLGVVALVKPKWGAYLLWVATWAYPIGLLQGLLPFNVRFDDLLLLWVLACVALLHRKPSTTQLILLLIAVWSLLRVFSNTVGLVTGAFEPLAVIRHLGKAFYIPAMAFIVWKSTHSVRDVRGHLTAILLGGIVAGVIGTLEVFAPELTRMWEIPDTQYESALFGVEHRRGGGALGPIYFAWTMMVIAALGTRLFLRKVGGPLRVIGGIAALVAVPSLLASKTRAAIGGTVVAVTYMLVRQRYRVQIVLVFLLGGLYVTFGTNLIDQVVDRFQRTVASGDITTGRVELWQAYLFEKPSIHYLLIGRGWQAEVRRVGGSAHSSYIGAISYTGIIGTILLAILFLVMWRRAGTLLRGSTESLDLALAEGLRAALIATLFASAFGEELFAHHLRVIGVLAVLCESLIYIRRVEWWRHNGASHSDDVPHFPARQT